MTRGGALGVTDAIGVVGSGQSLNGSSCVDLAEGFGLWNALSLASIAFRCLQSFLGWYRSGPLCFCDAADSID